MTPVMLFGPGLNGSGFVGSHPDLTDWDPYDNLIPSTDFRDVYNTVLTNWFCLDQSVIDIVLLNESYNLLDLGLDCETLSVPDIGDVTRLVHAPVYKNNRTYIELNMPGTGHVDIKLYDILGKEIGTIANEVLFPGPHSFDVRASINSRLSLGQYIYRVSYGGQFYSKSLLLK